MILLIEMDELTSDIKAPVQAISRLRPGTDGKGITTLVTFYGCPLRCKYCLNPRTLGEIPDDSYITPEELYERVKKDDIYFRATDGGVTFGGGEPCLRSDFIRKFADLNRHNWQIRVETSLNAHSFQIGELLPIVDQWIVDIKSLDIAVYKAYTGIYNHHVINMLSLFLQKKMQDKVLIRIPLIPEFNDEFDRTNSIRYLKGMGFTKFDLFTYKIPKP